MRGKTRVSKKKLEGKSEIPFSNDLNEKNSSVLRTNIFQISSASIALFALIFSIYQGYKIQENNELSVLPKIRIDHFSTTRDFQVTIKNVGVGPAIIDDIVIKNKDHKIFSVVNLSGNFWHTIFRNSEIPDSVIHRNLNYFILSPGTFISVDDKINFFGVTFDELSEDGIRSSLDILSNSSIYIKYHSIYDDSFEDSISFESIKLIKLNQKKY